MKIKRICDTCPCLNSDNESGCECNLRFTTESHWTRKTDGNNPVETVDTEVAWNDLHKNANIKHQLMQVSPDCKLLKIQLEDGQELTYQDGRWLR